MRQHSTYAMILVKILKLLLGAALIAESLQAQSINPADIEKLRQKYLTEKAPKKNMTSIVRKIAQIPVGQGWNGYRPTEWYFAAELTYAAGSGGTDLNRLRQALDFAERNTVENWWEIEVGIPRALARGLLRGGAQLPSDLRQRLEKHLRNFLSRQRLREWNGANTIYRGWTRLIAGLYFRDAELCQQAVNLFASATSIGKYTHIRPDGSYFFHNDKMNMFYGSDHFVQFADYVNFTANTSFALENHPNPYNPGKTGIEVLGEWIEDGIRWYTYNGAIDPLTINKFPHKWHLGRIKSGLRKLVAAGSPGLSPHWQSIQDILNDSPNPLGARAFPSSRYLAVRRDRFFAGLVLIDLVAPHQEAASFAPMFGAINLVTPQTVDRISRTPGDKNISEDILNVPSSLLSTMTVPKLFFPDVANPGSEHSNRVHLNEITDIAKQWGYYGVTTLNGYFAMAAQHLRSSDGQFRMKKSWFFFDDEIVVLISDLRSQGSFGPVVTWLQTFRPAGSALATDRGVKSLPTGSGSSDIGMTRWAHAREWGFYFPEPTYLVAEGRNRGFTRLTVDHQRMNRQDRLAFVLLPNRSEAEVRNYNGIEILRQDGNLHLVRDRSSQVVGAAMFAPVSTNWIASNLPGYILYQARGQRFRLTLYNPHKEKSLPVRLSHEGNPVNPMDDVKIDEGAATHHLYRIRVPFVLKKGAGDGLNLFDLASAGNQGTELIVNLRVYRKFEIEAEKNSDGTYSIVRASINLNDSYQDGFATQQPVPPQPQAPVAVLRSNYQAKAGEPLQFDASGSYDPDGGQIQEFIWNFGDGATARGARVSHSYASAGTYSGSLRLRDDEGQETTANFTVNVSPAQTTGPVMVIRITADDQYELYVNGAFVGRGEQWETAEEYRVPLGASKNVIAIKAINQASAAGILAEIYVDGKTFFSNANWRVNLNEAQGWTRPDFNDKTWPRATSFGKHGYALPWAQFRNVEGLARDIPEWIWSKDNYNDSPVYFRYTINLSQDAEPPAAPKGVRAIVE